MTQRPSNWESLREAALKRDNYRCANCSRRGGPQGNITLEVHHIVPLKDGGSNDPDNLKTLCEECHNAIHHKNKNAPTGHNSMGTGGDNFSEMQNRVADIAAKYVVGGFIVSIVLGGVFGGMELLLNFWMYSPAIIVLVGIFLIHVVY